MKQRKQHLQPSMGEKIKFYRQRLEMSQEDLALKAEVGLATLSELENSIRQPELKTIHKLSHALGLSPREIAYVFGVNLYISDVKRKSENNE